MCHNCYCSSFGDHLCLSHSEMGAADKRSMGGLEYGFRDDEMKNKTQEDFAQEHKRMACNWHADRARHSQNTTYTFIYM